MTDKKKSEFCTKHTLFLFVSVLITVGLYSAYQCDNINKKANDKNHGSREIEKKLGEKDQKEVQIMEKNARDETKFAIVVIINWLFFLILFATIIYGKFPKGEPSIYKIIE